jgi:hypothetical protein
MVAECSHSKTYPSLRTLTREETSFMPKQVMGLRQLNSELSPIKQVVKEVNRMNLYKHRRFKDYRVFWKHTRQAKTQEEFTKRMNEGIEKGVKVVKRMILDLANKIEREKSKR